MLTTLEIQSAYTLVFKGTYAPTVQELSYWSSLPLTTDGLPQKVAAYTLLHKTNENLRNLARHYLYYQTTEEVIRPLANWEGGITERIAFNTDILQARYGLEQRMRILRKPRINVEFGILLHHLTLQHFQNQINRAQGEAVWIPLWFGAIPFPESSLTSAKIEGVSGLTEGKFMLYAGYNYYEIVTVIKIEQDFYFQFPPVGSYAANIWIVPVVKGNVNEKINLSYITSQIATGQISSSLEPFHPAINTPKVPHEIIENSPVLPIEQNWVTPTVTEINRPVKVLDYGTGVQLIYDLHGYSDTSKTVELFGWRNRYGIRDFFLECAGRYASFYCPTFIEDLTVEDGFSYTVNNKFLLVKEAGLSEYYSANATNRYIYIEFWDKPAKIVKIDLPVGNKVPVKSPQGSADPFGFNFEKKDVRRVSFLPKCRFNSDTLEISWITPDVYRVTTSIITTQ